MSEEETMKVHVTKPFRFGGEKIEDGQVHELPKSVAKAAMEKGNAKKPEKEEEDEGESLQTIDEGISVSEGNDGPDWNRLEEKREQSGTLPAKWNPAQNNPEEPDPNPLNGRVVRTGDGPNGKFIVVEEKDSDDKHTVWEHTALRSLLHSVKPKDLVSIKFEGQEKNKRGQNYLSYKTAAMKPNGEDRILQEPEED